MQVERRFFLYFCLAFSRLSGFFFLKGPFPVAAGAI